MQLSETYTDDSKLPVHSRLTVGSDPEFFLTKGGIPFPAIGLVGGSKEKPKKLGMGHVQEDNVMAELNPPPAKTAQQFSQYTQAMIEALEKLIKPHGLEISKETTAEFEEATLYSNEAAMVMGCEPDYNAWTGDMNIPVNVHEMGKMRTAAGHIHIGFPEANAHPRARMAFVRNLDIFLGIPLALKAGKGGKLRRRFYGKAGAFRPTQYGVEYRVPDNSWAFDKVMQVKIWQGIELAYRQLQRENYGERNLDIPARHVDGIQMAINNHDHSALREYVKYYRVGLI